MSQRFSSTKSWKKTHSRWLTTAYRIFRLYVSSEDSTDNLRTLEDYIMKVYAPMWSEIKCKHLISSGPLHVFKTIQFFRCSSTDTKNVIDPVIQRNAFFHTSRTLLSVLVRWQMRILLLENWDGGEYWMQEIKKYKMLGNLKCLGWTMMQKCCKRAREVGGKNNFRLLHSFYYFIC